MYHCDTSGKRIKYYSTKMLHDIISQCMASLRSHQGDKLVLHQLLVYTLSFYPES